MASYYRAGKTFTVAYRLKGQRRRYIYGIRTESLAKRSAAKKTELEQIVRADLHTPDPVTDKQREAAVLPILEHVIAFGRALKNKGGCRDHYVGQESHVRRLLELAKVSRLSAFAPDPIQGAAAKLLADGLAPRTVNAAIKAAMQFSSWLVSSNRAAVDVLHRRMTLFNEAVDVRRRRRELLEDEIAWLIDTTARSRKRRAGLSGADRAMLYLTGLETGFRQRSLLGLDKGCFRVAPTLMRPSIVLPARFNKNGTERVQRIRRDVASRLRPWLEGKADHGPVWRPFRWAKLGTMFRRDLEAAREAWLEDGGDSSSAFLAYEHDDGRGKVYADFHSLRHTGITLVVRNTKNLRLAQVWAGHSTPVLTAKYAHLDMTDEDAALEALPAADLKPIGAKRKKGKTA